MLHDRNISTISFFLWAVPTLSPITTCLQGTMVCLVNTFTRDILPIQMSFTSFSVLGSFFCLILILLRERVPQLCRNIAGG